MTDGIPHIHTILRTPAAADIHAAATKRGSNVGKGNLINLKIKHRPFLTNPRPTIAAVVVDFAKFSFGCSVSFLFLIVSQRFFLREDSPRKIWHPTYLGLFSLVAGWPGLLHLCTTFGRAPHVPTTRCRRPLPHLNRRIRKNKGRWTQEEHEAFLRGVRLYERNWEAVAALVPTRTVLQIRTHSQK